MDADRDGFVEADDCDDGNPLVHPGAHEKCDMLDSDCDGELGRTEIDSDGDGLTTCAGDCDDDDPERGPTGPGVPLLGEHTTDDAWVHFTDDLGYENFQGRVYVEGYGASVLLAGDLNGDGFGDVVVRGRPPFSTHHAYVFDGPFCAGILPASAADAVVRAGVAYGADFGLGRLGDITGDGFDDLRSGPYIYYGPITGELAGEDADVILYDWVGSTAVGDFNGDGLADLAVGHYAGSVESDPDAGAGLVMLHWGPLPRVPRLDNADSVLEGVNGPGAQSFAGAAIANVGDTDGDGAEDLAIFSPMEDSGGTDRGAVYLWRSPYPDYASLEDAWARWTEIREGSGTVEAIAFFDVAVVGDTEGVGAVDLIVTSDLGPSDDGGQAWYLPTQPGPGATPVREFGYAIMDGGVDTWRAMSATDSAGDLRGDGVEHWIVSGPSGVAVGSGAPGGTVDMVELPVLITTQSSSISGGIDTNADGYDDFLIGGHGQGAWLFLGGLD